MNASASGLALLGWLPCGRCPQDGTLLHVSAVYANVPAGSTVTLPGMLPPATSVEVTHGCGVPAAAHPDPAATVVHG